MGDGRRGSRVGPAHSLTVATEAKGKGQACLRMTTRDGSRYEITPGQGEPASGSKPRPRPRSRSSPVPSRACRATSLACFGPIDLPAQAEVASARRSDTPNHTPGYHCHRDAESTLVLALVVPLGSAAPASRERPLLVLAGFARDVTSRTTVSTCRGWSFGAVPGPTLQRPTCSELA